MTHQYKKLPVTITMWIQFNVTPEDERGELACLYKKRQAAITDGGLFTDTGINERGENIRQSEDDSEIKAVS